MKIPTPTKNKNGTWHIRGHFTINGEHFRPSITADTKAECIEEYKRIRDEYKARKKAPQSLTVRQALEKYIELSDPLSPSTLAGYRKRLTVMFQDIMDVSVDTLTDLNMQAAVNREAKRKPENKKAAETISAKTLIDEYGLLSAALKTVCGLSFTVKLPRKVKRYKDYPTPETVFGLVKDTEIELPCLLAMWLGLRMSEVRGLKCSSIRGQYLYIEQVRLYVDGLNVEKSAAKTYESNRRRLLPGYILELVKKTPAWKGYKKNGTDDFIIQDSQTKIYKSLKKILTPAGYPDITFHDLRHLFASAGAVAGIPALYLAKMGGWSNTATMERVYQEAFGSEMEKAEQALNRHFEEVLK